MPWKGIKHNTVGDGMNRLEFEDGELHELESGEALPENAHTGDFYFKTAENRLYIYIEEIEE